MSLTKLSYAMIQGAPVNVLDFGAKGDGVTDDTQALKDFFTMLATGASGYMPAGTYSYDRSQGELSVDCDSFILDAAGAIIQCSAYPVLGNTAIINFVKIKADYIYLNGLTVDGGWDKVGNRVDNYCYSNGFFNYMHGLLVNSSGGFIDNVTIHDCEGLGFTTEDNDAVGSISDVNIGKLTCYYNWMIGVDFRSQDGYVKNINVDEIICYNNGTRGSGWVQVNFGDIKSSAGTSRINVNSINAHNGGGSGVGLGQYANPASSDISGTADISIGRITAFSNAGHGVELYASINCNIGHINAYGNTGRGVYFERSDTNDLFGYVAQIESISCNTNGLDGVLISGWNNVQISSITSWNNGTSGSGYSGVLLYAASLVGVTETGRLQIGAIRSFDDRSGGSRTQNYGIGFSYYGAPTAFTSIASLDCSNNKVKDVAWLVYGHSKTVAIGEASYDTITPDYSTNSRVLLTENGAYKQKWQTTNATLTYTLVARPKSGQDCIATSTAVGRNSAGTTLHFSQDISAFKWNGTGWTKQNTMQSLAYKTGASDSYANEYGTGIGVTVTGIAATTINWDVTIQFSTQIDRDFSV